MPRSPYSPEVRERAVRMVLRPPARVPLGVGGHDVGIAAKLGMTPETLRNWVRRAEVDDGQRAGLTTDERAQLKELEKEIRELRRANEILKDASIFFATELDGRTKK